MNASGSPERLAAFRILLSLYLLGYLGSMAPHVTLLFSSEGVYVPFLLPDLAPSPMIAAALYGLMLAGCLALLLGLWANASAALVLVLFLHHYFLQLAIKQSSFDRLIVIYLVILCFADAGATWSLGAWRRSAPPTRTTALAERLIAFQTVALYLGAGLWKACNPRWHGGEMLWFTLQDIFATPVAFWLVGLGLPELFWSAATLALVAFELCLGACFIFARTRPLAIAAGLAFHGANWVLLDVPEFLICVTAYPVFLPTHTLQRWAAKLAVLTRRSPASAS